MFYSCTTLDEGIAWCVTGESGSAGLHDWGYCVNSTSSACTTDSRIGQTTEAPADVNQANAAEFDWGEHVAWLAIIAILMVAMVAVIVWLRTKTQAVNITLTNNSIPTSVVSAEFFSDPHQHFGAPIPDKPSATAPPLQRGPDMEARDRMGWLLNSSECTSVMGRSAKAQSVYAPTNSKFVGLRQSGPAGFDSQRPHNAAGVGRVVAQAGSNYYVRERRHSGYN